MNSFDNPPHIFGGQVHKFGDSQFGFILSILSILVNNWF